MKRIFIAGGTGFIGTKLYERFLKKNNEVFIITRNSANHNENSNLISYSNLKYALTDGSVVINLAGANISKIPWSKKYKKEILNSRIQTTESICNSILDSGKNVKLISASAIGYYGNRGDEKLDENSHKGNDYLSEICYEWEKATNKINNENKAIIRIGVVLDRKAGALPKMVLPFTFFSGNILGIGSQWLSWIHIEDLVNSIEFIIVNNLKGIHNLVADSLRMKDFSMQIGKTLKRPVLFRIPEFILKSILGESSQIFLNSQRVQSKELKNAGFTFKYKNIEQTLNNLLK